MRNLKKNPFLILILILSCMLGACEGDQTTINNPTGPVGDQPPTNNSAVVARAAGVCPALGPCIADFSVSLAPAWTVAWVFTGARRTTSVVQAGVVEYLFPGTYLWSSTVTNPFGTRDAQGSTTFIASSSVGTMAVAAQLITQDQADALVAIFDGLDWADPNGDPLMGIWLAAAHRGVSPETIDAIMKLVSEATGNEVPAGFGWM